MEVLKLSAPKSAAANKLRTHDFFVLDPIKYPENLSALSQDTPEPIKYPENMSALSPETPEPIKNDPFSLSNKTDTENVVNDQTPFSTEPLNDSILTDKLPKISSYYSGPPSKRLYPLFG